MGEALTSLTVFLILLLILMGIVYWAHKAQDDRSALVGIYLFFGIPSVLLIIAGISQLAMGNTNQGILALLISAGLGLPLLRPFRELLARVTPLDPDSVVDMTGLCIALGLLAGNVLLTVSVSGGQTPDAGLIPSVDLSGLVVQALAFVMAAYVAVGYPYWRDLRTATARLGIVVPDARTVGIGIGGVFACFLVSGLAGLVAQHLDPGLGDSIDEIVNQMTLDIQNPIGAFVLGASAGIGEEAVFRGAMQPRFGLVLTSLLFALMHAPQYGLNVVLLGLFGVSIILGLQRKYVNTTAAMITHALYNAVQVLALSMMTS